MVDNGKECQGMQYPGNEKFLPVDENTWGQVSVQWRLDFSGGRREDIGRDDGDDQEGWAQGPGSRSPPP